MGLTRHHLTSRGAKFADQSIELIEPKDEPLGLLPKGCNLDCDCLPVLSDVDCHSYFRHERALSIGLP
jgi:hypothetical protein